MPVRDAGSPGTVPCSVAKRVQGSLTVTITPLRSSTAISEGTEFRMTFLKASLSFNALSRCVRVSSRWLKPPISWPISSSRATGKGCGGSPSAGRVSSALAAASSGDNSRRNIHQVRPATSSVSMSVASSMCCCMARIGAKASSVGRVAAMIQPATATRLSETRASTPGGLTITADPSKPSIKRSMTGLMPGAGSSSMRRLLSVAVTIRRRCGSMSR